MPYDPALAVHRGIGACVGTGDNERVRAMRNKQYTVAICGFPRQHYDDMMAALNGASKRLYMGADTWRAAGNALRAGHVFHFSYGFTDATIYPPGVPRP